MLEEAIARAKTGDKEGARTLLRQIVAQDPRDENAWGWLAVFADTATQRRLALERVLEINPENERARRALESLLKAEPLTEPERSPRATVPDLPPQLRRESYPRRFWNWSTTTRLRSIVVFSLIITFGCCCPLGAIGSLIVTDKPTPTSERGAVEDADLSTTPSVPSPPATTLVPTRDFQGTLTAIQITRDFQEAAQRAEAAAETTPTGTPAPTNTPAPSPTPEIGVVKAQVIEVVNGDTIKVLIDDEEYAVRYIGVDTPEIADRSSSVDSMGRQAAAANEELVGGRTVLLEKDVSETDRYGRLLRYVYVGDTLVNEELVRLGFALARSYPPDTKHDAVFAAAQQAASDAGVGMWAPPTPVPIECLDSAYVADVTVPDNTHFQPGASFVKTWRVRNTGGCAWPPSTRLVVVRDDALVSSESVHVGALEVGETTEVSVEMTAPPAGGRYQETWQLADGDRPFGGNLTVVIQVESAAPTQAPHVDSANATASGELPSILSYRLYTSATARPWLWRHSLQAVSGAATRSIQIRWRRRRHRVRELKVIRFGFGSVRRICYNSAKQKPSIAARVLFDQVVAVIPREKESAIANINVRQIAYERAFGGGSESNLRQD